MGSLEAPNHKVGFQTWSLCHRFSAVRLTRIIGVLLVVLVLVPLFTHYYLSKFVGDDPAAEIHHKGVQLEDLDSIKAVDLRTRIEEMIRIKTSVSNELRELESRRQRLQSDISTLSQRMEELKSDYNHQQVELERLRVSVEQAQYAQKEVQDRNSPHISAPKRILPSLEDSITISSLHLEGAKSCRTHLCFDFSRCSLTSGFPVYFYHPDDYGTWSSEDQLLKSAITEALNINVHITFDPAIACVYVVLVGPSLDKGSLEKFLHQLAHWSGDGRNHILLNLVTSFNESNKFLDVNTGRAIIVQSLFSAYEFREGFDIVAPPLIIAPKGVPQKYIHYSPARRKFLLSYQGEYMTSLANISKKILTFKFTTYHDDSDALEKESRKSSKANQNDDLTEDYIIDILKEMQISTLGDNFFFQFSCAGSSVPGITTEWLLCGTMETRCSVLHESTFALIISPLNYTVINTHQTHIRIYEALKTGAIPILMGSHIRLPYDDFVDWNRAIVILPKARISELHYYLRTFTDGDIQTMRRQGHLYFERYLANPRQVVSTILAVVRNRIQIPAPAAHDETSPSVFNATFQPLQAEFAAVQDPDPEENLGPVESPFPSMSFRRNLTYTNAQRYFVWNNLADPFTLYPYTPFDPILPSESKFIGSSFGFRPIGQGAGGSGKEFSEALGGNSPREQFTIVILTYEREAVLIDSLQRLRGLPYLNKVVVVWNGNRPPAADLRWPEIGVPIHVIKAKKNSLNNRFLPYDAIETEAVLSVDDDAHLRHDEIIFGFRVWREARDRIVGFPGRYHAWDSLNGGYLYNSNYSCELSMVLTGAAFFHKYYTYLYSYSMPQTIRDKVDEYMNCEDIAMNFLVSHITRKPPLKVTSRWTFRCPGCPISLSEEDSHFQERHKCINHFMQVYGYMPLLHTQFRVDSVLFKTRIPHDKQKCFKFI